MGKPEDPVAKVFADLGIGDADVLTVPPDGPRIDWSADAVARRQREHAQRAEPDGPVLVPATDIKAMPIGWLWRGWLAKGKLHLLAGAPGQGKTTIALSLAATVSRGGAWPDGTKVKAGNVLIWSGEDDAADTLLPRLLAMGADPRRVFFVQGTRQAGEVLPFDPARDLVQLTAAADRLGSVALAVVDPVVSAVAGDSHKNGEVRRALQPLVDIAVALDSAVLGITHFSKGTSGREPTERVTGSVAFGAVARVVLVAAKVKSADGDRRIFARAKSNIGPDEGGFAYELHLQDVADQPGLRAATIQWGDALPGTARELLAEAEQDEDEDNLDAADFLRDLLAGGPMKARDVKRHADDAGFAWRSVQRAMKRAGVESRREGFPSVTTWSLKASRATVTPVAPHSESGATGATGATVASDCPFLPPQSLLDRARDLVLEHVRVACLSDREREQWLEDAADDPAGVVDVLTAKAGNPNP